jgi:hypothetical protein
MQMLIKFLTNAILFFRNMFKKNDYRIIERTMEYWVDHDHDHDGDMSLGEFWDEESCEWDGETDTHYVTLDKGEAIPPPPKNVSKLLVRVKYWYNNRVYKFITYDHDYVWPPAKKEGMIFTIPLVSAQLLDFKGEPVHDLLGKINRYSGPHRDFYDMKIHISDMFYYEIGLYPKIRIKNLLGFTKTVSTLDGYISDLRAP